MRPLPFLLLFLCAPAAAGDVDWTLIDVKARLDADGRLHVVETHHMRVDKGGFSLFREFGLGADQAIAFKSLTRVDADGSEHPLADSDVESPESYRYYPRGHAYYRLPELAQGGELAFRFEYDLVNAVAPAWGIAAGPNPLLEEMELIAPWRRVPSILADWREAWPDLGKRWRLDQDVLLPSRQGPAYVVHRFEYRLETDRSWARVRPAAELAVRQPDGHYRIGPLFEYLGPGRPSAASWREAGLRLGAVAALPVVGLVLWLALLAVEAFATRGSGPVDRAQIVERLLPVAPEVVAAVSERPGPGPSPEAVLSRLAAERKIAIEVGPMPEEDSPDVRMRLLVPRASLPAFERELVEKLFPEGDESGSVRLGAHYAKEGLDPGAVIRELLAASVPAKSPAHRFLPTALFLLAGIPGFLIQFRTLSTVDFVFFVIIANGAAFMIAASWPKGWWHAGQPKRGLLVPLVILTAGYLGLNLAVNRPVPAAAWVGGALVVLACHAITLAKSRMRADAPRMLPRHLSRIRRFAEAELRRPRPRLEDAWIPHLQALGLEPQLEAWRARSEAASHSPVDLADVGEDGAMGPRFTGRVPVPFVAGPPGWVDGLYIYAD